jgi:rubredoxin
MKKISMHPCGYIYDPALGEPDAGIAPGTAFEELPEDFCVPFVLSAKTNLNPSVNK